MKGLYAEIIKNIKTKKIIILMLGYIGWVFALFFKYTIDENSGVIEPLLRQGDYFVPLVAILYSALFNIFFSVICGATVGAAEYSYGTMSFTVYRQGRIGVVIYKVSFLILLCLIEAFIITGVATLLCFAKYDNMVEMKSFIISILISFISTWCIALIAFTISVAVANYGKSITIGFIYFLLCNFLPYDIGKYMNIINPYTYLSDFVNRKFQRLNEVQSVKIAPGVGYDNQTCIFAIIMIGLVCLIVSLFISKRREIN